ncbi:hypothetical protein EVJ58_g1591 [Rhodofomes roseus]|uniref:Uncharacterized protein n=1 Tax=Rhodofomes roseus TaxID=34475 RepID=A0A4Y9Z0U9_9APHY|nr:hypothetical protein EVJ58_g1591 [Rhodofomes roseus]
MFSSWGRPSGAAPGEPGRDAPYPISPSPFARNPSSEEESENRSELEKTGDGERLYMFMVPKTNLALV